jgi:hypothetical protein
MDKKVLRYEGFVRKINENQPAIKPRPSEEDETKPVPIETPAPTAPPMPSIVPRERPSEEDEPMASLDDLHGMFGDEPHGAELMDNILKYDTDKHILKYKGIEVEVPSETGSYMVNGKNLKTKDAQKAYDYVQAQVQNESKSYSKTRKFEKRTKK